MQIGIYLFVSQIESTQVKQHISSSFETNYMDNSSHPDDGDKNAIFGCSPDNLYIPINKSCMTFPWKLHNGT